MMSDRLALIREFHGPIFVFKYEFRLRAQNFAMFHPKHLRLRLILIDAE